MALKPSTFAKKATIIQIDIDPSEVNKNVEVDLSVVGDAAYILQAMLPMIEPKEHPEWMAQIHDWQAHDYHPVSDSSRLMPHQVIGEICSQCGPEAVYVTDVGQHQMWAAQYLRPRQEPRLHHQRRPGHHGLWLRRGHRRTDGPWAGPAGGHAHRRRLLPYESERSLHRRQLQPAHHHRYFQQPGAGHGPPVADRFLRQALFPDRPPPQDHFVKLAEGFGLKGYHCENLAEFQAAFAEALKNDGPTWIECMIAKDEKVLPMIPGGGDINDIMME